MRVAKAPTGGACATCTCAGASRRAHRPGHIREMGMQACVHVHVSVCIRTHPGLGPSAPGSLQCEACCCRARPPAGSRACTWVHRASGAGCSKVGDVTGFWV
eukprot:360870-Chlamydomonas_euryale.AAC.5